MKTILYISALCIFFSASSQAQKDTTINLSEVNVSSSRLIYNCGLKQRSFDSTLHSVYITTSLSELLNENTAISLKNYGPGQLSTISLRGGSAYHTALLWNGFLLTSPLNGLTDISLEKNLFFEDVNIQYGGSSSLWGSGAVSGSIHLNNYPKFNSGLKLTAGFSGGSFSNFHEYAGISYGNKNYSGKIKFYYLTNLNNFSYIDNDTKQEEEQINSQIKQYGIMNENYFITGKNSIFNFRIWYNFSDRQIPPAISQTNTHAQQKDVTTRFSAEWNHTGKKIKTIIRSALFFESFYYTDDFLSQPSDNKSKSSINEITCERNFSNKHLLQAGINYTYSNADSSVNLSESTINNFSLFTLYRYHSSNDKLEVSASVRQEFSSINSSPIIFSGGVNYFLLQGVLFRTAASRVFRNPTINDLYWVPGGNKNLEPEKGWSAEAGFNVHFFELSGLKKPFCSSSMLLHFTAYSKEMNDWIIWYPTTSLFWSPQNLLMVFSRGLETGIEYSYTKNNFSAGCKLEYNYTISTNEKTASPNDASLHQQLIYIPIHRWNSRIFISYRNFYLNYNRNYTGKTYTTSDNSEYLDPYTLDNIQLDKIFTSKTGAIKIFFRVNNIFNTNYQSVMNRPMPLRSFETGLSLTYSK